MMRLVGFILRAIPVAIKPLEKLRKPSWVQTREAMGIQQETEHQRTSSCPTERKKWLQVGFLEL